MGNGVTRRFLVAAGLSALAGMARADAPSVSLRPLARPDDLQARATPDAKALIARADLGGQVGFSVSDVKTGLLLEGQEARTGLPPASVTKAVTALYALDILGAEYRFATRLFATGVVRGGVLQGDLILAGGGDPTLDTDALADMARQLKNAGVTQVRGAFRVWDGAVPSQQMIDPGQPAHAGYNPAISGLSLNFNRVHFEWKRNGGTYQVTMDARTEKYRPNVRIARMAIADRSVPVYTYRDRGDYDSWTVARGALGNGGARWLPVRKPALYAGEVFATLARSHGIVLKPPQIAPSRPGGTVLVTHQSAALREVLRDMLKYSTNLTAEMVGMAATARRLGRSVPLAESAREMSQWARQSLGMEGARLADHSGLGVASRLTAQAMTQALVRVHGQGALRPLLRDIALRGDDGRVDRGHSVSVSAKTGTLYFVSALAGYMTAPDGTELAFAMFMSNNRLRGRIDPSKDERPPGARSWNRRAKALQQDLIERWAIVYGS